MRFSDLRLCEPIQRAVAFEGYTSATPIQIKAIPPALEGRDVVGSAQTGTGKTAAFALPILQRLSSVHRPTGAGHSRARCLVLCPTRELATQIADGFRVYGKNLKLKHTVIFGGVGQNPQVAALKHGVDIVVATPGRLLDLMNQGHVDLRGIEILVLDEADRMLDMGFINDIRKIVAKVPGKRQTLLFSATMPREIRELADTLMHNAVTVEAAPVATTAENISQSIYFVEKANKPQLLAHLVDSLPMTRAIVFTRTKHGADKVVRHLHKVGIRAEAIHGNKSQNARTRALENFRSNKIPVLVATDIASRGIDIDDITHVVNYDLTHEPETYVHRIGRTARAGASGAAVSFCDRDERSNLRAIERLIRKTIPVKSDHPTYVQAEAHARPQHAHRATPQSHGSHGHSQSRTAHRDAANAHHERRTTQHAATPRHAPSHPTGGGVRPRHAGVDMRGATPSAGHGGGGRGASGRARRRRRF